mgnify:CR=1 FL=1
MERTIIDCGSALYGTASPPKAPLCIIDSQSPSDGCAIVLLPGLWATAELFAPLVARLGKSCRAIGLTFRGSGRSARSPAYAACERAYDVAALVQSLGLERLVLLAVEDSGGVALQAATLLPGRVLGLILWNTDVSGGHRIACDTLAACLKGSCTLDGPEGPLGSDAHLWSAMSALCTARASAEEYGASADGAAHWADLQRSDPAALRATLRCSLAARDNRLSQRGLPVPLLLLCDSGRSVDASREVRPHTTHASLVP